jgi:hypothetical protein
MINYIHSCSHLFDKYGVCIKCGEHEDPDDDNPYGSMWEDHEFMDEDEDE